MFNFNTNLNVSKFAELDLAQECCEDNSVIVKNGDYYVILNKEDVFSLVNSEDIDVRIEAKKLAKELGYAVIPCNGRYEIMPTRRVCF